MIWRNTELPATGTLDFYTFRDGQTMVKFRVFEGDEVVAADNRYLGEFSLSVPPMKAGAAKILVTFEVHGWSTILKVSAAYEGTSETLEIDRSQEGRGLMTYAG